MKNMRIGAFLIISHAFAIFRKVLFLMLIMSFNYDFYSPPVDDKFRFKLRSMVDNGNRPQLKFPPS